METRRIRNHAHNKNSEVATIFRLSHEKWVQFAVFNCLEKQANPLSLPRKNEFCQHRWKGLLQISEMVKFGEISEMVKFGENDVDIAWRSLQVLCIFVLRGGGGGWSYNFQPIFLWNVIGLSGRITNINKFYDLRSVIFSVFYDISQPVFPILLIFRCSF